MHITADRHSPLPDGYRTVSVAELQVDRGGRDRSRRFVRAPLADVFFLPIIISAVRSFDPFGGEDHQPRLTVGRTVLRRAR